MARLSKTHTSANSQETGPSAPDPSAQPSTDHKLKPEAIYENDEDNKEVLGASTFPITSCVDTASKINLYKRERTGDQEQADSDADDERRNSACSGTSGASVSGRTYETDKATASLATKPCSPQSVRLSFERSHSVGRLQVISPPHSGSKTAKSSFFRHSRTLSRPRAARASATASGSPMPKRRIFEESRAADVKSYPLVLLHITLLEISLPWSRESIQDLLSPQTRDNLQILQSKVSETVLQRGILIPHPREEYELLEDRFLEALELKRERVTKCGHFQVPRDSSSYRSPLEDSSDSGLGLSVETCSSEEEEQGELCRTCHQHIKTSKIPAGLGKDKWSIKVYAANGLMRASAWAAAWNEMESVDVEILPWISEDVRRELDQRREREVAKEAVRQRDENERMAKMAEQQLHLTRQLTERSRLAHQAAHLPPAPLVREYVSERPLHATEPPRTKATDLPQVYRPSEIPLSVLLKNYVCILAKDRRNIAIFLMALLTLVCLVRPTAPGRDIVGLPSLEEACSRCQFSDSVPSAVRHCAPMEAFPIHLQEEGPDKGEENSNIETNNTESAAEMVLGDSHVEMLEDLSSGQDHELNLGQGESEAVYVEHMDAPH